MTGTMTTTCTDTKLGTDRTATIIDCTRNSKALRTFATTVHCLEEELARKMNFTYHNLQHKTVHQLKQILERKFLDAILKANTQINQNYFSTSKPKSPWKKRTVRLGNKWKKVQPEQKLINLQDDRTKCAKEIQRQRKSTGDTQRKRTIFVFGGIN